MLAMLANCHRDPKKKRPFKPEDFDPYAGQEKHEPEIRTSDLGVLKTVFVDRGKGGER